MLLFIFQILLRSRSFHRISIHPMLLFIINAVYWYIVHCRFQYIPCYCLSSSFSWISSLLIHFNTSHVTVYRAKAKVRKGERRNFNTSHVTVYQWIKITTDVFDEFQYIPCYCLSLQCIAVFMSFCNFNTSHVTVYLYNVLLFLCPFAISIHPMLLFISDVAIFNSHPDIISIHPMLLFIGTLAKGYKITGIFQYIPCYCLSNEFNPFLLQAPSSFPLFYAISTFFTSRL